MLIIGAGAAGMLTAQALRMQGLDVKVYEQDRALDQRTRDWNYGIYWAQVPLHDCLPEHLAKRIEDAQVDDHRAGPDEVMPIFNGQTEALLKNVPAPYNIRLARRRFLRLIREGLDVAYGKKLKSVSSDGKLATATFEDGTKATGDLLIGTEGAHSVVREYLVGPEKANLNMSPLVASVTMAKLPVEAALKFQEMTRRLMVIFHPDGYFNWIGLHDAHDDSQPGDWTFMMIMTWIPTDPNYDTRALQGDKILADMKQRAEVFGDRIKFMWQSIPEGTPCWHNRLSYWVPEPWDNHNGTITIAGDAAHPMTFHRGQGLNNAIQDAALIAREIKLKGFTPAAVDAYEKQMLPRAQEAVVSSNHNSMSVHDWDTLLQSPLFTTGLKAK